MARARMFHERFGHLYANPSAVDPSALREGVPRVPRSAGEKPPRRIRDVPHLADERDVPHRGRQGRLCAGPADRRRWRRSPPPVSIDGVLSETMRIGGKRHLRSSSPSRISRGTRSGSPTRSSPFPRRRSRPSAATASAPASGSGSRSCSPPRSSTRSSTSRRRQLVDFSVRLLDANLETLETLGKRHRAARQRHERPQLPRDHPERAARRGGGAVRRQEMRDPDQGRVPARRREDRHPGPHPPQARAGSIRRNTS